MSSPITRGCATGKQLLEGAGGPLLVSLKEVGGRCKAKGGGETEEGRNPAYLQHLQGGCLKDAARVNPAEARCHQKLAPWTPPLCILLEVFVGTKRVPNECQAKACIAAVAYTRERASYGSWACWAWNACKKD